MSGEVETTSHSPIIHCITNYVVANFVANGLVASGASPIMGDEEQEVVELVQLADALSLNIGTLSERTVRSMKVAGEAAVKKGIPRVVDPVGAGASTYRLQSAKEVIAASRPTLIRCNAGEAAALLGVDWQGRGVDAGTGHADASSLAVELAKKYATTVVITGAVDFISDGKVVLRNHSGHPDMTRAVGTGCLLSSLLAAWLVKDTSLEAIQQGLYRYGRAGEMAVKSGIGGFSAALLEELANEEVYSS
ncbi:hydroxyethylthiazole kinase [Chryseomicrobium sp. FSL W7-1435]|uniref:hydroxyethylthiazole kinase n=1 Tax=Chryseomicrobium sp. FSL W7-1435 TaxID=2921704 RepID=UPI00315AA824